MVQFENRFYLAMLGLGCLVGLVALGFVLRRAFGRQAGEIGGWELRGAGQRIAAVARATFAEGLRTKVASGFAVLILVSIPVFWLTAEGDGTIKGQVQMFITYALGFTTFVLSLLTIFFSCRSLALEVASRQIYTIATKPIPRWQLLVGKWVGIMTLNVILLGSACVATYVGTRAMVSRFKADLGQELQTYCGLTPEQASNAVAALERVSGVGREGVESPIVEEMAKALGRTPQQLVDMLRRLPEATRVNLRRFDELRRQVLVARASVSPDIPDFKEEVDQRYRQLLDEGRLPEDWTDGKIKDLIEKDFVGMFCTVPPGIGRQWEIKGPVPKKTPDFIMSVRFKLYVPGYLQPMKLPNGETLEENTLLCAWGIGDPTKPNHFKIAEPFATNAYVEFEIPTSCVEPDGTIQVAFGNIDPRVADVVLDLPTALQVLYRVASFETNVFHVFLAALIPIICLASCGVCASTFLSYPVGSTILITLFIISSSMWFVYQSLAVTAEYVPPEQQDFEFQLRRSSVDAIGWVLSLGDCGPVNLLREGRGVGWPRLWENCWKYVLVKSSLLMATAVLVLRRRELAAIIV